MLGVEKCACWLPGGLYVIYLWVNNLFHANIGPKTSRRHNFRPKLTILKIRDPFRGSNKFTYQKHYMAKYIQVFESDV